MENSTSLLEALPTISGKPNSFGVIAVNIGTVLLALQFLFFGFRIYTKATVIRFLSWDDLTCTAGFISTIFHYVATERLAKSGEVGYYTWEIPNLPMGQFLTSQFFVLKDIYSITYGVGIIFMKLSFAFYFWNLFSPRPWKSSALKLSVISTGALYLAYTAIAIYCMLPRGPKTSFLEQPEKLSSDHLVFVPDLAAMSVFYDLYILSLLLGGIWKVKIGLKMRYIMSTVFLIRVVSCVYLVRTANYRSQPVKSQDALTEILALNTICFSEMQIGIICCCIPSLMLLAGKAKANYSALSNSHATSGLVKKLE